MEKKGREEARKILERLNYHVEEIRTTRTKFPYDIVAVKGKERFLIDVKCMEEEATTPKSKRKPISGFPFPWISRAYQVLHDINEISDGWEARVLLITKYGARMCYLFLEPNFEKPWFECRFEESDYESIEGKALTWLKEYARNLG